MTTAPALSAHDGSPRFKALETLGGYYCDSFMKLGNRWECEHGVIVWPEQVEAAEKRAAARDAARAAEGQS